MKGSTTEKIRCNVINYLKSQNGEWLSADQICGYINRHKYNRAELTANYLGHIMRYSDGVERVPGTRRGTALYRWVGGIE